MYIYIHIYARTYTQTHTYIYTLPLGLPQVVFKMTTRVGQPSDSEVEEGGGRWPLPDTFTSRLVCMN